MSADRITDDWHDLVSYRDDEIAQGSLDNFSLPHIFLLHAQPECMFLPFKDRWTRFGWFQVDRVSLGSKLRTGFDRWLENTRISRNQDFATSLGGIVAKNMRLFIGRCRNVD
jgi:hypothetical protein